MPTYLIFKRVSLQFGNLVGLFCSPFYVTACYVSLQDIILLYAIYNSREPMQHFLLITK